MVNWKRLDTQVAAEHGDNMPAAKRIRHLIRAAIGAGELAPGARMTEANLGAELNVSRTPLREALAALKAENLLHVDEDGLRVRKLLWADVNALYEMRSHLEGLAARLAANDASPSEKAVIAQIADEEVALINKNAAAEILAAHNARFHLIIWKAANNPFLLEAMQRLSSMMILLGATAYSLAQRRDPIQSEHAAITAAIIAGDGPAAEAAMQHHLNQALIARLSVLSVSQSMEID